MQTTETIYETRRGLGGLSNALAATVLGISPEPRFVDALVEKDQN
jgi:hypothetical protein